MAKDVLSLRADAHVRNSTIRFDFDSEGAVHPIPPHGYVECGVARISHHSTEMVCVCMGPRGRRSYCAARIGWGVSEMGATNEDDVR
jgi:hypothetical protein